MHGCCVWLLISWPYLQNSNSNFVFFLFFARCGNSYFLSKLKALVQNWIYFCFFLACYITLIFYDFSWLVTLLKIENWRLWLYSELIYFDSLGGLWVFAESLSLICGGCLLQLLQVMGQLRRWECWGKTGTSLTSLLVMWICLTWMDLNSLSWWDLKWIYPSSVSA